MAKRPTSKAPAYQLRRCESYPQRCDCLSNAKTCLSGGMHLRSDEAGRFIVDLSQKRRTAGAPIGDPCISHFDYIQEQAAVISGRVIEQARRRSKAAIEVATRLVCEPCPSPRDAATPAVSIRPSRFEALLIDRPELAAELRLLIDEELHRGKQMSMQEIYRHFLDRLRSRYAVAEDEYPFSSKNAYGALRMWVRRTRRASREDLW